MNRLLKFIKLVIKFIATFNFLKTLKPNKEKEKLNFFYID